MRLEIGLETWLVAQRLEARPDGLPRQEPRGRELHPIQKAINELISKVWVNVEHAIAGIKRCPIVSDIFRNRRQGFVDEVMLAASGLHNLRGVPVPCNPNPQTRNNSPNTTPYKVYCLADYL